MYTVSLMDIVYGTGNVVKVGTMVNLTAQLANQLLYSTIVTYWKISRISVHICIEVSAGNFDKKFIVDVSLYWTMSPSISNIFIETFWINLIDSPSKTANGRGAVETRLTRNQSVVSFIPAKGPRCFLEQETLTSLLSPGIQQRIQVWLYNRTKIIWVRCGCLTVCQITKLV